MDTSLTVLDPFDPGSSLTVQEREPFQYGSTWIRVRIPNTAFQVIQLLDPSLNLSIKPRPTNFFIIDKKVFNIRTAVLFSTTVRKMNTGTRCKLTNKLFCFTHNLNDNILNLLMYLGTDTAPRARARQVWMKRRIFRQDGRKIIVSSSCDS